VEPRRKHVSNGKRRMGNMASVRSWGKWKVRFETALFWAMVWLREYNSDSHVKGVLG
jgi:hypothetical protein